MLWRPDPGPVRERDVRVLANRHAELGLDAQLIPYVEPLPVTLRSTRPPVAEPVERRLAILPQAPACPTERRREHPRPCVAVAPSSELAGAASGLRATLRFTSGGDAPVEVPVAVTIEPRMPVGLLGASASLAGRMNAARLRNARFDVATGLFQVAGPGKRFFRAYAADVDALGPLLTRVRAAGEAAGLPALMEPWSRFDDVARIRRHADSLQTLFLLIAAVSGASGVFALAANVYAGVQRKRVELAYLQLLGIPRARLLLFPLVKSVLVVAAALAIALLAYAAFAHVAAPSLGDVFRQAGELMRLTTADALRLGTLIIAAAMLTSLLAGMAVLRIEPSAHIRD
jgi:putative ABC transport system permease protein